MPFSSKNYFIKSTLSVITLAFGVTALTSTSGSALDIKNRDIPQNEIFTDNNPSQKPGYRPNYRDKPDYQIKKKIPRKYALLFKKLAKEDLQPITRELIDFLRENPEYLSYLDNSLRQAARLNPDPVTNPAQSVVSYISYVDQASRLIPQEVLKNPSSIIREQILQSICYFYFLIDQPIENLKSKEIYKNTLQYDPAFSVWTRNFADAWGDFLNTSDSFTEATYQQFLKDPNFRLATGDYEPRSNWNTFNRFFSRYLSDPSVRPIAEAASPDVVVAPADSVPQGVWAIDEFSNIVVEDASRGFRVKNTRYFNVNDLLGPELAEFYGAFENGVLTHTFLNVFDYHRYHFPVGGEIIGKSKIQQNVALEVSWDPLNGKYVPIDSTGWQFTQTRGVVVMQTENYGKVAVIPMGMAHVSSVNFEDNVVPGAMVEKGDMLGTFLFGGSDYIMLFQKEAGFVIQAPEASSSNSQFVSKSSIKSQPQYQHILMGERLGQMTGK